MRTQALKLRRIRGPLSLTQAQSGIAIASSLALAGGVVRLPFVRETPINWDAVQFVLAVGQFDLHAHQPHPPGYILYVLLGRALNALVGNPNMALAYLSVLAGAITIALIYLLGQEIFQDTSIALGAALLTMASPLGLYYGSVALTYMPEMALGVGVAALAWTVRKSGSPRRAALLGLLLGIAGGVRQTSVPLLLPLCIWALWGAPSVVVTRQRSGVSPLMKRVIGFVGALVLVCVAWLIPLLYVSVGVQAYLLENTLLAEAVSARTSLVGAGLEGLGHNLLFVALGLVLGLAFAVIPLGLWAARLLRFTIGSDLRAFLLWWTLPPLAFYAVSHVGQYGYLLVVLPPIFLLSAACVRVLAMRLLRADYRSPVAGRRSLVLCAGVALLSAGYFGLAEGPTTAANVRRNHDHWRAVQTALREMDAGRTVLVMGVQWDGPFRTAGYLLPQFHSYALGEDREGDFGWLYWAYGGRSTYALPSPPAIPYLPLPEGTRSVVALDNHTGELLAAEGRLSAVSLRDGSTLYVLTSAEEIEALTATRHMIKGQQRR